MVLDLWEAVMEPSSAVSLKRSKSEPNLQTLPCNYQRQEAMISWLQEQIRALPANSGSTDSTYSGDFEQTIAKTSFAVTLL